MSDKITLSDLSQSLASGLAHALDSYQTFKAQDIPTDAKGFTAYHNACKSALLHIALLVKLMGDKGEPNAPDINWLQLARQNLKGLASDDLFID